MLTRNGKVLFTQSENSNGQAVDRQFKITDGNTASTGTQGYGIGKNIMQIISNIYIAVGSGTTAPTVDDYNLEAQIGTLTVVSSSNTGNRTPSYSDNYIHSCSRTFKNNTESAITVTEIGMYSKLTNSSGSLNQRFLIVREVITPVTIQPGATYTFSITIG